MQPFPLQPPAGHTPSTLVSRVIAAAAEVQRTLGPGWSDAVYEEALSTELASRAIAFRRQAPVEVSYRGRPVGLGRLDLLVDDRLVLEIKAQDTISPADVAKALSYLRAGQHRLGLIFNFNAQPFTKGIRRICNPWLRAVE